MKNQVFTLAHRQRSSSSSPQGVDFRFAYSASRDGGMYTLLFSEANYLSHFRAITVVPFTASESMWNSSAIRRTPDIPNPMRPQVE